MKYFDDIKMHGTTIKIGNACNIENFRVGSGLERVLNVPSEPFHDLGVDTDSLSLYNMPCFGQGESVTISYALLLTRTACHYIICTVVDTDSLSLHHMDCCGH
jgi:hypothetical protein